MRQTANNDPDRPWIVDYSAARARAIEWLGDRYLLARPINRRSAGDEPQAGQRRESPTGDRD